ncbi:AMP-binding protein [Rhodoferax sp.]|uniref:AMP-binding protein n=1 Tax=Rhodoferax sp. TaxID=50421 RepID=UPI002ACEFA0D|nr:AMP-binding protein [Rhodoferax sp.]MDZ7918793.1 AMP-binding protein [Rhodoferax sp.]
MYREFLSKVGGWRATFEAQAGSKWALYFDDSLEFSAALLGAWHAGKMVYLPGDNLPATLASLRIDVDGFAGDFPTDTGNVLHPVDCFPECTWAPLALDTLVLTVYTSGSNGAPSAIPKYLRQLDAEVATLAQRWDSDLGDATVLATVSHQHIYGLLFHVLWPLASGRPLLAMRLPYLESVVAELTLRPAVLIASPAHLKRLPVGLDWKSVQHNLRAVFSSGGPLPEEAARQCHALMGGTPTEIYGSSETGGIAWRQNQSNGTAYWTPLPGVSVRLEGEALQVRSPHLPDKTWFQSADKAQLHHKGFVLLGRADRLVKIEEKRISLTALERSLMASGYLDSVALVLLPGERVGLGGIAILNEKGWAKIQLHGKQALNQALHACLVGQVETIAIPRRWRYVWALPVNSQGKTAQSALVELFDPRDPQAQLMAREPLRAHLRIPVSARLPYFEGHFHQMPILPGVAQVEWAIAYGKKLFSLPPHFLRLETIKFQRVISPGDVVDLYFVFLPERSSLEFKLQSAEGQHAAGRIVFGARP